MMNADGTGQRSSSTNDGFEKRGAAWSPDGLRILFACRMGQKDGAGVVTFDSASWTVRMAPSLSSLSTTS